MLDLPAHPVIDKQALIGGCLRLPIGVDAERLRNEVDALPESLWGTTGPRIGVHGAADALFLRGYLPAEGNKSFDERPALALLPYARAIIEHHIPATPLRCLLARLPAGGTIVPHVDHAPYFSKTVRLHIPVITHDRVFMSCDGQSYIMRPGEIWALNNSAVHGVWNAGNSQARTHMICDFLPEPGLAGLLSRGERGLGKNLLEVREHLMAVSNHAADSTHLGAGG